MTETNDPRNIAIIKYFSLTPAPPKYRLSTVGAICGSVLLILCLLSGASWLFDRTDRGCSGCLTVLLFSAGSLLLGLSMLGRLLSQRAYEKAYRQAEPKPSDAQVDIWFHEDLERLRARAFEKLDLDERSTRSYNINGQPLVVHGPGPSPMVKIGEDNEVRFSINNILIIYLTQYHIASYQCIVNLVDGSIASESTREYHFDDVVSVSTETENTCLYWIREGRKEEIPNYLKFALSVASGEQIAVAISFPGVQEISMEKRFINPAHNAVKVIRVRLREKKGGTQETGLDNDKVILD